MDANALVNNWTRGISTVTITTPATGSTFTAGATINMTATATSISPFTVNKVEFYSGSTLLGTSLTNNDVNNDILWRNPVTGENTIWFMNGVTQTGTGSILTIPAGWAVKGVF